MDQDAAVRVAAFEWLERQVAVEGEVLPWATLHKGFTFQGRRVPLVSQQGIFKPAVLQDTPLSIRTAHDGPYSDSFTDGNLILYRYQGKDRGHWQNVALRRAMATARPLVYLLGVVPARYLACWPAFVVHDDPTALTFTVSVDDATILQSARAQDESRAETDLRRRYVTATVRKRVHQHAFRERVLVAYRSQCAMCRLRHSELLDASHIVPDKNEMGEPHVDNGLALCKIHHAAFDRNILGVTPDYDVVVREDVLQEIDGPMLRFGLQELEGSRILVPRRERLRPRRELLEMRFEEFRKAG